MDWRVIGDYLKRNGPAWVGVFTLGILLTPMASEIDWDNIIFILLVCVPMFMKPIGEPDLYRIHRVLPLSRKALARTLWAQTVVLPVVVLTAGACVWMFVIPIAEERDWGALWAHSCIILFWTSLLGCCHVIFARRNALLALPVCAAMLAMILGSIYIRKFYEQYTLVRWGEAAGAVGFSYISYGLAHAYARFLDDEVSRRGRSDVTGVMPLKPPRLTRLEPIAINPLADMATSGFACGAVLFLILAALGVLVTVGAMESPLAGVLDVPRLFMLVSVLPAAALEEWRPSLRVLSSLPISKDRLAWICVAMPVALTGPIVLAFVGVAFWMGPLLGVSAIDALGSGVFVLGASVPVAAVVYQQRLSGGAVAVLCVFTVLFVLCCVPAEPGEGQSIVVAITGIILGSVGVMWIHNQLYEHGEFFRRQSPTE